MNTIAVTRSSWISPAAHPAFELTKTRMLASIRRPVLLVAMTLSTLLAGGAQAADANKDAARMPAVAKGSFTVQIKPASESSEAEGVTLGRMSLDKQFEGDLAGTGKGEMLTALTPIKGSAGYVAIERFVGTLHGRSGSFVFQHTGTMNQGEQSLSITVVPGSGTGDLSGISGTFNLTIVDGKHLYEFSYELPQ